MFFNKTVSLRIQANNTDLAISVDTAKGTPEEPDALDAMDLVERMLIGSSADYTSHTRNTPDGDRVDMVIVTV